MRRGFIITIGIIAIFLFLIYSGFFAVGSYPYSQTYEFSVPQDVLIDSMKRFKEHNPDFKVPEQVGANDEFDNTFYHVYLYYRIENKIVHLYIKKNMDFPGHSLINLIALNEGLALGKWKEVNSDFARNENLQIKKQFETTVLDRLGLKYSNEGNGMFIFWK